MGGGKHEDCRPNGRQVRGRDPVRFVGACLTSLPTTGCRLRRSLPVTGPPGLSGGSRDPSRGFTSRPTCAVCSGGPRRATDVGTPGGARLSIRSSLSGPHPPAVATPSRTAVGAVRTRRLPRTYRSVTRSQPSQTARTPTTPPGGGFSDAAMADSRSNGSATDRSRGGPPRSANLPGSASVRASLTSRPASVIACRSSASTAVVRRHGGPVPPVGRTTPRRRSVGPARAGRSTRCGTGRGVRRPKRPRRGAGAVRVARLPAPRGRPRRTSGRRSLPVAGPP